MDLQGNVRFVQGLPPAANSLASTIYTDIINCKLAGRITFVLIRGVGTTGTSTITVEACDNVSASNHSAVAFRHGQITGSDVEGAMVAVDNTGYTTTAGSNAIDIIDVDVDVLAASGYGYIRLKSVEVNASSVLAGILVILSELKDAGSAKVSPLT